MSVCSRTTEKYKYVVRYFDVNKNFLGNAGSEWILDETIMEFKEPAYPVQIKFADVKFIRLIYKSNENDANPINTISGTLEIEEDGDIKTLIMTYN